MKSDLYSKHAEKYALAIQDNIYNALLERPSLQAMLKDLSGLDVLDLGCGSGIYTEYLIAKGVSKITCIDFSKEMIGLVQQKFKDRVSAYTQDLSIGLPKEKSNSIDVIICPLVIHYLEDLTLLFKDVSRVLKPGGYMVFSTHHPFADFQHSKTKNYFEREFVEDIWDTINEPVPVAFYRRSLTEIMNAISEDNMVITQLSEGTVLEKAKELSSSQFEYLSKNPNFIFIKCQKLE